MAKAMRSWVIKTLCGAGEVVQQLKHWPLFQRTQVSFPAWDTAVYNPVTTIPGEPMSPWTSLGILRCQTFMMCIYTQGNIYSHVIN